MFEETALSIELREIIYKRKHHNALSRMEYFKTLLTFQDELIKLQYWVVDSGQKIVVIFEEHDSTGKGASSTLRNVLIREFAGWWRWQNPVIERKHSGIFNDTFLIYPLLERSSCSTVTGTTALG